MKTLQNNEEKIKGGFFLWARQIFESDIFRKKPHGWYKVFSLIIGKANFSDGKYLKRGECMLTLEEIKAFTGVKIGSIRTALKYMVSEHMIEQRRSTRGTIKFVLMYDKYQRAENYDSSSASTQPAVERAVSEQSTQRSIVKNKELKKNNTEQNNSPTENNLVPPLTPKGGDGVKTFSKKNKGQDGHTSQGTNSRAADLNPRALGTNSRAADLNPRALGTNSRAADLNPRALEVSQGELEDELLIPDYADGQWVAIRQPLTPIQIALEPFYNAFGKDFNYSRNTKAAQRMLKNHSAEDLANAAKFALSVAAEQYAPVITDAISLERRMNDLKAFKARKENPENNPRKIIKF